MKKIGNKKVLEVFLQDLGEERKDGEKTSVEIHHELLEAGHKVTLCATRNRLKRLCDEGKLLCRKAVINGKNTNLYYEP